VEERAIRDRQDQILYQSQTVQSDAQAERAPDPLAAQYIKLLNASLKAQTSGLGVGMWRTGVYLLGDGESYYRLASEWRGIFSSEKSLLEPVRVWEAAAARELAAAWDLPDVPGAPGPGPYQHPLQFQTLLTSDQLGAYIHLPALETNGFAVQAVPLFDAVPHQVKEGKAISLGKVIVRRSATETEYRVDLDDLTRHVFVAGLTGSGKTNTIFHILKEAAASEVPFLVLDPAKTEYRELLEDQNLHGRLQIFTLGNEWISPFRLNPFEVVGHPTISVGTHLDLLVSVFSASFGMWPPLPQILEQSLHAVYKDRGWDIASNTNHRLDTAPDKADAFKADAFPTLAELATKADQILGQLGYEGKVVENMRAALLTRLNGLRAGGKGRMLNVQRSLPMDALLENPTILELQDIGADEDKAFLMGLLLIRLYEYRLAHDSVERLRHLIVIEEAHRLLTNVGPRKSEEEGDARGKAVETFTNILAEIRAYGQGVIVADQIPGKLAPEIMKNTNLKMAHRLVAVDDRKSLAGTMVMDEPQTRALATLSRGQAAVFSEGDDAPILVEVPKAKGDGENAPSPERVRDYMSSNGVVKSNRGPFHPLPDVNIFDPTVYTALDAATSLADDPVFKRDFVRLVVSITEDAGALDTVWNDLVARSQAEQRAGMDGTVLLRALVTYASAWFAHRRGGQEAWSYADTEELSNRLRTVLLAKLEGRNALQAVQAFRALMHRLHARLVDPFPGCSAICTQSPPVCLYRRMVADFIGGSKERLVGEWKNAYVSDKALALEVSQHECEELVGGDVQPGMMRRICLCYAQHMLSSHSVENHRVILRTLLDNRHIEDEGSEKDG
jgi:hypothetical protein